MSLLGFPAAGSPFRGVVAEFGFEVPQGDPGELDAAARRAGLTARGLESDAEAVRRAVSTAGAAWRGAAQSAFGLRPDEALLDEVGRHLDRRKLVGTRVRLLPMRFRGVSVVVNLQVSPRADVGRIEQEVLHALYVYLNPLTGGSAGGRSDGWPTGRSLNQGELYAIVLAFEGVEHVRVLRLYEFDLETGEQAQTPAGRQIVVDPDEVIASGRHIVKATRREE